MLRKRWRQARFLARVHAGAGIWRPIGQEILCSLGKNGGKRVKGIEPSCPAWEAGVLPLNYTRGRISDCGMRNADCKSGNVTARK